jgi:hypothetical protein
MPVLLMEQWREAFAKFLSKGKQTRFYVDDWREYYYPAPDAVKLAEKALNLAEGSKGLTLRTMDRFDELAAKDTPADSELWIKEIRAFSIEAGELFRHPEDVGPCLAAGLVREFLEGLDAGEYRDALRDLFVRELELDREDIDPDA